jgi:hypothetical protein
MCLWLRGNAYTADWGHMALTRENGRRVLWERFSADQGAA